MKNEVFYPNAPHDKLSLPVPADAPSGAPVIVGSIVGVLATKENQGGNPDGYGSVWCEGVYRLLVITNTALTVGAPVYIITAQSGNPATALTTTSNSGANPVFGYALEAKGTAPATIRVKLAKV
jgi:predicted RecA/RadA family phage recombinase